MAKSPLQKKLDNRDRAEKRILEPFTEKLDRTFEVIYEVEAETEWVKLTRFSPVSHFVMVFGRAVIKEGTELNGNKMTEDYQLDISFGIPWAMLEDDKVTPYQLADMAHNLELFRQVVDPADFMQFIRSRDGTYDKLLEQLPSTNVDKLQELGKEKEQTQPQTATTELPEYLVGFDIESLTDEQKKQLWLTTHKA